MQRSVIKKKKTCLRAQNSHLKFYTETWQNEMVNVAIISVNVLGK